MDRNLTKFVKKVQKLGISELIGLATLLSVSIQNEKKELRMFEDFFPEMLSKFNGLSHRRQKEILKLISR